MAAAVKEFPAKYGRAPHLVVVLVGDDPASVSYVTGKAKASAEVGIRNTTIRRPAETGEAELLALIGELNADDGVDGILVQLPLPKHIDEDRVIAAIRREKDEERIGQLTREIEELKAKEAGMRAKWQGQRDLLKKIQANKDRIESLKIEAQQAAAAKEQ